MNKLFLRFAISIACVLLTFATAEGTAHAYSWTACARIKTSFTDTGIGEDHGTSATSNYVARFTRLRVTNGYFVVKDWTYADSNGCVTFDYGFKSFTVSIDARARVDPADVPGSHYVNVIATDEDGNVPTWTYTIDTTANGGTVYAYTQQEPLSNLFGAAVFGVYRFGGTAHSLKKLQMMTTTDESGHSTLVSEILAQSVIPETRSNKKYLVAHEIGHSIQALYNGRALWSGQSTDPYAINDGGAACTWKEGTNHALQSKEYAAAAFIEGFAQFYATAVYNDYSGDGFFHYYKDDYKPLILDNGVNLGSTVKKVNMGDGPTGGDNAYLVNRCSGTKAGRGVELDWARQFWDYMTASGSNPGNPALMRQLNNAMWEIDGQGGATRKLTLQNAYDRVVEGIRIYDAANSTSFRTRFENIDENGIDQ